MAMDFQVNGLEDNTMITTIMKDKKDNKKIFLSRSIMIVTGVWSVGSSLKKGMNMKGGKIGLKPI